MVDREQTTTRRYAESPVDEEAETSHKSETIPTVRDGVADLVGRWRQKRSPRRKHYSLNLDLDAQPAADAEPNTPSGVLDV
jgi:hypothetical protein